MPGTFFHLQPEMYQKMMSQKGQRHMMMPATPGSGLVMIHPQFALGFLNRRFDRPAQSCLPNQIGLRDLHWRIAQIIFDLGWVTRATTKDHPDFVPRTAATLTYRAHKRKVGADRAFRSFFDRVTFPDLGWRLRSHLTNLLRCRLISRHTWPTTRTSCIEVAGLTKACRQDLHPLRPYHRCRGHFGEVPFVESGHTVEKTGTHSIMRIGINPGEGHNTALNDLPEHLQAKLWLRLKDQVLWNPAFFALGGVLFVKPRFRHIKPTIQKRVAQTGCIGEKNSLLTVSELAQ